MKRILKLWSTLLLMMVACVSWANPADPTPHQVKQPDGTTVTLSMHGDENLHYVTTADGFTVMKDDNGFWVYARKQDDGTLAATTVVAHDETDRTDDERAFLDAMPKGLVPKMDSRMEEMRQKNRMLRAKTQQQRRASVKDFYKNYRPLIILVEYNDRSFMYGDDMNSLMNDIANKENYKGDKRTSIVFEDINLNINFEGSVCDYFRDNSNGLFQPQFDVVGPVKIDRSQYFAEGTTNGLVLANEVVDAVDEMVDFSQYDGDGDGVVDLVYFVYAGFPSNDYRNDQRLIWPHAYYFGDNVMKDGVQLWRYACSTELIMTEETPFLDGIGTICHEITHTLGLPDFYDSDGEGSGGFSPGIGYWSLMGYGSNLGYKRVPCNLTIYERLYLDFIEGIDILDESGTYSLREASTNDSFYIGSPDTKDEGFIFENRQQVGWDAWLPGHGLLVFHLDWRNVQTVNNDPDHMFYKVLFAGGNNGNTPASDPFPGEGKVTTLTNTTSPANLLTNDGNNLPFGLAHIRENFGFITFDLVDANTYGEIVMPEPTDMLAGICYHLEPEIVMPTTTYETKWESDNHNVATVDEQGNVTAVAEGTAHITLTIGEYSATYNATVVPADVVPNIESLMTRSSKTYQVLQLNNAQVFLTQKTNGRNWVFVRDGTRSVELIDFPLDLVPGDVLNGLVYGRFSNSTEWMAMHPVAGIHNEGSIQITHGDAPEPDLVTADNLNSIHVMDYITMKGVTLGNKQFGEQTGMCMLAGEEYAVLKTDFVILDEPITLPSPEEAEGNLYDLEMVVYYFNNPDYANIFALTAPITLSQSAGIDQPLIPLPQKEGIYNLQGQRIRGNGQGAKSQLPKGIYIVNGHRVVIK